MDASFVSEVIQEALVLEKFIIPNFKLYSRMKGPVVHVQYYRQVISLY